MANIENRFRTKFVTAMKETYGDACYHQKHHGSEFSAGLPDMLFVTKDELLFIEFKALPSPLREESVALDFMKVPTALQLHTLSRIWKARKGAALLVVWYDDLKLVFAATTPAVEKARRMGWPLIRAELMRFGLSWNNIKHHPDPLVIIREAAEAFERYREEEVQK
jgi:hypothetical protein